MGNVSLNESARVRISVSIAGFEVMVLGEESKVMTL
jgi:hypothetical protein